MSELVANCPRCGAKNMTFDLLEQNPIELHDSWQDRCEAFCVCRACERSTVFILAELEYIEGGGFKMLSSLSAVVVNRFVRNESYICLKDMASKRPPKYLPSNVEAAFREGAACLSMGCFNAAGTMFRLSIDHTTRPMLPEEDTDGLNSQIRRSLGLRLGWLFDTGKLPDTLRDLSTCIKNDGNDGAHQGTLTEEDASDILDFTFVLLERIFTEPKRLKLAHERREARRAEKDGEE